MNPLLSLHHLLRLLYIVNRILLIFSAMNTKVCGQEINSFNGNVDKVISCAENKFQCGFGDMLSERVH